MVTVDADALSRRPCRSCECQENINSLSDCEDESGARSPEVQIRAITRSETAKNFISPDNVFVLEGWQLDSLRQAQQYSPQRNHQALRTRAEFIFNKYSGTLRRAAQVNRMMRTLFAFWRQTKSTGTCSGTTSFLLLMELEYHLVSPSEFQQTAFFKNCKYTTHKLYKNCNFNILHVLIQEN